MSEPWKFNRHERQNARYKNELDTSQVAIYKRWDEIFDGFYADKKDLVMYLADRMEKSVTSWRYTIDRKAMER